MKVQACRRVLSTPLTHRLVVLVSALLLIPLVFQFVYVSPYLRDREIQREYDAQEARGDLLSERTESIIAKYRLWLENIRQHESVRQLDPDGIETDLSMRLDVLEWMHAVAVVDEGSTAVYTAAEPGFDEVLSGYLRDDVTLPTQVSCGTVKMHEATGHLVFPLYIPIPSTGSSGVGGFLFGVFDLDEIRHHLTEDLESVTSTAFLVDEQGRLLVTCCVDEDNALPLTDFSAHPALAEYRSETSETPPRHHIVEEGQLVATHTEVAYGPWSIIVETPLREIVGRSSILGRWVPTVNASVLGIMLALAWMVTLRIARERTRHEQRLHAAARRDALTGLRNRFALDESVLQEEARAQRYGHPVGILLIDVNRFKEVNDRFGHQMGDRVLEGVAEVLRKSVRETDIVFRYGGDEFLVLLPETLGETGVVRQRIQEEVSRRNERNPLLDFPVTLAIGLVEWEPQMDVSLEQIISQADARMYANKRRMADD